MNLTLHADLNGVERQFEVIIDSLAQLDIALKRFGKYLRVKAQNRFNAEGPGWPPISKETIAHRQSKAGHSLGRKLQREVNRAKKRFANTAFKTPGRKAASERSIQHRIDVLREFDRMRAGKSDVLRHKEKSALSEKQQSKLKERISRAEEKASHGPLLGRMASSLSASVSKGQLTVESTIEWSEVHNEGGTVGHGAVVPKREFLCIEEDDLGVLEGMLLDVIDEKLG